MVMRFKLLAFVVAALFAGTALAGGQGKISSEKARQSFDQLDQNQDHQISRDEAKIDPTLSRVFNELDSDRDGQLSATEYGETAVAPPARQY